MPTSFPRLFIAVFLSVLAGCVAGELSDGNQGSPRLLPDGGTADGSFATDPASDASVPDAGIADGGFPDAGIADAGLPDANVPDAGVSDGGVPDPLEGCDDAVSSQCLWDDVNRALDAWQIGMPQAEIAASRDLTSGYAANPKNWITVGCESEGLTSEMRAHCRSGFAGSTVGTCWYAAYGSGEIIDTAIALNPWFLNEPTIPEADKIEVIIHEIGHCIGLRHTSSPSYVMYSGWGAADLPHENELNAVAQAYLPPANPPPSTRDAFFYTTSGGNAVRHFEIPTFTLNAEHAGVGQSALKSRPQRGEPLQGEVIRGVHEMQMTGCTGL